MRTTVDLPVIFSPRRKSYASTFGVSLNEFFVEAVEQKLRPASGKKRKDPPALGGSLGPQLGILTAEQLNEAMFG